MTKPISLLIGIILLLWGYALPAQGPAWVPGEILVQFNHSVNAQEWVESTVGLRADAHSFRLERCLSQDFNIWTVRFDWEKINEQKLLQSLRRDPAVQAAQFNHYVELRSRTPNDSLFGRQWHLNNTGQIEGAVQGMDLGMLEAWDLTTGGVTPQGDTIVICVIDNGLDLSHEDFAGNLWMNHNEIPGNGVDDDNNGYVDDYRGWNVADQDDGIDAFNFHGTITAGIIGARGNNRVGVTGINWQVKLMIVVGGFGQAVESKIVEAYAYCLTQRKLYNSTNGARGALVVASNSSWGISKVRPEEYPIWCSVYDSLGAAGIINIGATDNANVNVDSLGDMPTACGSDYLITVTNIDAAGKKLPDAAFGAQSIDLGAFGETIFTTNDGNRYGTDGGTSFAAPMVTGAIGLLYSADCPTFSSIYSDSPAEAALLAKEYILRGTVPEPSLDGITLTGGRLNIYNSLNLLLDECGSCPPLLQVGIKELTDQRAALSWFAGDAIQKVDLRWRRSGFADWELIRNVSAPYVLDDLQACTDYEYQFRVYCTEDTLDFESRTFQFKTDGCCDPPGEINFGFIGFTDVLLNWEPLFAATSYNLRYRELGTEVWNTSFAFSNSGALRQLMECTKYELQIRTVCGSEQSAYSASVFFTTRGCGACIEAGYCIPRTLSTDNSEQEWIQKVEINSINQTSTGSGYTDFTNATSTELALGETYPIRITQEYASFAFDEFFRVWIDFNQNGVFEQAEVVASSTSGQDSAFIGTVQIPLDAMLGSTRMRVIMKFDAEPAACVSEVNFFGEVEDYCVTLVDTVSQRNELPSLGQLSIFPNPARERVELLILPTKALGDYQISVLGLDGRSIWGQSFSDTGQSSIRQSISLKGAPPGMYIVRVAAGGQQLYRKLILY